jgi:hypothetical protein
MALQLSDAPTREPRPSRVRGSRASGPAIVAAIAILAAVAAWMRIPSHDRGVLWAEDGRNFIQNAIDHGAFSTLTFPYAGYLHTLPRLIAGITVSLAPPESYALWMCALSCAAAGIMAAIVYVCTADVISWMPARVLIASITVLAPLEPREILGNTANLHSIVLWTLFWVLLYRPRTRWGSALLAVVALIGTATEIQAVFLLPLLLIRPRDRWRWPVRCAYLLGLVAQGFATLADPRHHNTNAPIGAGSSAFGYLINGVVPEWVMQADIGPAVAWGGLLLCLLLAIPAMVAVILALRWGTTFQRLVVSALVLLSIVAWGVGLGANPRPEYDFGALTGAELWVVPLVRYGIVPSMLLLAVFPILASIVVERGRRMQGARMPRARMPGSRMPGSRRLAVPVASGILVVFCVLLVAHFTPVSTVRTYQPSWNAEVAAAEQRCDTLPRGAVVSVEETLGWHVHLPCGLIN